MSIPVSRTALRYFGGALLLGGAAVVGLGLARSFLAGVPFEADRREHAFFYLYTCIVTTAVLCAAGWALAKRYDALRRSRDRFEALSRIDSLTRLANAHAFRGHYRRLLDAARCTGAPLSLLVIDVDDLKRVNDEHGHPAGSAVLRRVAAAIEECKRTGDVAARWGGDEFALLLPGAALDSAVRVAEAVTDRVRRFPVVFDGRQITVTVTIGVATRDDGSCDDLFGAADAALFEGKRAGRDRVNVSGTPGGGAPSAGGATPTRTLPPRRPTPAPRGRLSLVPRRSGDV
jgi:diguanylate cyclase (GGDEF)-like protein